MQLNTPASTNSMFTFFKTRRSTRLVAIEKMLAHYLTVINKLSDAELARGLDMAAEIKSSSLEFEEAHTDYWNAFHKPVAIKEKTAERIQAYWTEQINMMHQTDPSQSKLYAAGMSIWSHSLLAAAYPELRQLGLNLWKELHRGFKYCHQFDPRKDVPEVI